jgi:flavorubredoxin
MKTVVVYYSRFGTTRTIATALAEELGAEVRKIQAVRECGFMGMGFRSAFGIRMPIQPMNLDFTGVDRIVLCAPIWAGKPANPARTFLQEAKIEGKVLAVVFSSGGGETSPALEAIRKLVAEKRVDLTFLGAIVTRKKDEAQLRAEAKEPVRKLKSQQGE